MTALFLFLFSTIFVNASQQPLIDGVVCLTYRSEILNREVPYCIQRSRPDIPPADGEPVVYFMHGIMANEKSWWENGYNKVLDCLGQTEKIPAVTFVTFRTSHISFFSDRGGQPSGENAYGTWFVEEFVPYIESLHHLCHSRKCRGLMGVSMGGFGALKMAFSRPDLFGSVAAHSPALVPLNLYDSNFSWIGYFSRHPITAFVGMFLLAEARGVFSTRELADSEDPLKLALLLPEKGVVPKIYFDVGLKDAFGFQEGVEVLRTELMSMSIPFESRLEYAGHFGWRDQVGPIKFLLKTLERQ